jgi:hypothetical protein
MITLSAPTTSKPWSAASATKNSAAGKLTPVRNGSGSVRAGAVAGMGGRRLVLTGGSPGGGRRLLTAAVGIEGVIGDGSESAILSATSTVAITLVTAG